MSDGILFAGNFIVDQIKFIEAWPSQSSLTSVTDVDQSIGGLACNCLTDVAKLDPRIPLFAIGIVGEDALGDFIIDNLKQHPSIDLSGIRRSGRTSFTDVMTTPDGARTFFQYRGANAELGPEHFEFDKITASFMHVGYALLLDRLDAPDPGGEYATGLCRVLAEAKRRGITTSIDVVSEESDRFSAIVPPALRYTDICVINETEAGKTAGVCARDKDGVLREENLFSCAKILADMGASKWVVIHAPEASCGLDVKTGAFFMEKSWKIPDGFIKSSVGAGDAFASGVLISAYYGRTLKNAIHVAGAAAAYSLCGNGASDSIKPLGDILTEMESYKI